MSENDKVREVTEPQKIANLKPKKVAELSREDLLEYQLLLERANNKGLVVAFQQSQLSVAMEREQEAKKAVDRFLAKMEKSYNFFRGNTNLTISESGEIFESPDTGSRIRPLDEP